MMPCKYIYSLFGDIFLGGGVRGLVTKTDDKRLMNCLRLPCEILYNRILYLTFATEYHKREANKKTEVQP